MKISRKRTSTRQTCFRADLTTYDAEPPTRELLIDELPEQINPEREAVALYLIFGPWSGGEFVTPRLMGPNTAAAIARDAAFDFFPGPIEYYPKPLIAGTRTVTVSTSLAETQPDTFISLPASQFNGSLRSPSTIAVANNSDMFQLDEHDVRPLVGIAMLFAESLSADVLNLPGLSTNHPLFYRLVRLLDAVRLGLTNDELESMLPSSMGINA